MWVVQGYFLCNACAWRSRGRFSWIVCMASINEDIRFRKAPFLWIWGGVLPLLFQRLCTRPFTVSCDCRAWRARPPFFFLPFCIPKDHTYWRLMWSLWTCSLFELRRMWSMECLAHCVAYLLCLDVI